jgi:hypothetical protein
MTFFLRLPRADLQRAAAIGRSNVRGGYAEVAAAIREAFPDATQKQRVVLIDLAWARAEELRAKGAA